MGWMYANESVSSDRLGAWIEREVFEHRRKDLLAGAIRGRVHYAAFRRDDGTVYAVVTLIDHKAGSCGYKTIDEFMGPMEYECPRFVLEKLSPLRDFDVPEQVRTWATQWRVRCWAKHGVSYSEAQLPLLATVEPADGLSRDD